ncbi:hypothetical protein [Hoyosella altamirensis]|uniref:Uncharacterized protein n=1 Tax=Hoyosella altamirensis TaxID=616997 RepID=A0A839RTA5_9ACTN|nr:hypothetical protein [Hoyosella altamirensis]MBB3039133.1 hypothetical protein [Hoyosella altamirensis]
MKRHVRRKLAVIALGVVAFAAAALHPGGGLVTATDAAFNDAVWARANIGTDTWPTQGYGRGAAGAGVVTDNLLIIGSQQPIPGASALRSHTSPGRTTHTPSLGAAQILFFTVSSRNASACGAYTVGAANPNEDCDPAAAPHSADAATSFSNLTGRVNLLGLIGLYTVIQTSGAITGAARCDDGSPTAIAPAGNNIAAGTLNIPIPTSNGTFEYTQAQNTLLGRPYIKAGLTRQVQTSSNGARSYLHIRLDVRYLAVIDGVIDITLVDAECNLGGLSPFAAMSALSQPVAANVGRFEDAADLAEVEDDAADSEADGARLTETSDEETDSDAGTTSASEPTTEANEADSDLEQQSDEPSPTPAPAPIALRETFAMRAIDGTELGSASISDIVYTTGCPGTALGEFVAIQLDITTSDQDSTSRVSGVTASSFGTLSTTGDVAKFTSSVSGCTDAAPAIATTMAPSSTYRGWIVFDVRNTDSRLVFQPNGTAGWSFTLPPAPPPPTPVTTPPPETTADAEAPPAEPMPVVPQEPARTTEPQAPPPPPSTSAPLPTTTAVPAPTTMETTAAVTTTPDEGNV